MNDDIQNIKDIQTFKQDPLFAYFNILERISQKLELFSTTLSDNIKSTRDSDLQFITEKLRSEISSMIPPPVHGKDAVVDYEKIKSFILDNSKREDIKEESIISTLSEKINSLIPQIDYEKIVDEAVKNILKKVKSKKGTDSNVKVIENTPTIDIIEIKNIVNSAISKIEIPKEKSPYDIARELESLVGNDRLDYFSLKNRPGTPTYTNGKDKKGGGEGSSNTVISVTNNYTVPDNSAILIVKSPITVTLPKISSDSKKITITNQSSGQVTVSPYSGDLINDDTSLIIRYHNSTAQLVSSDLGWIIV